VARAVKVGIVGVGTIGKSHMEQYAVSPRAKVVAVADVDKAAAESAAARHGIKKVLTDYRELVALPGVEAVDVCTPPFAHAPVTIAAANAGKHVLCEKPMALNSREANRMVEACRKAGVKLGIASGRSRLSPNVEMARRYVASGKLGKLYYARATTLRRRGRPGLDILQGSKWFLDASKAGGGALIDIGCYDVDVLLYLAGSPQPFAASAMTFRGVGQPLRLEEPYDVEEHATLFVRFEGGLAATFETAWASNMHGADGMLLFGTKGGLRTSPFTFYAEQAGQQTALSFEPRLARRESFIEDFAKACRGHGQPKTPGEDGLKVMQIIDMAYTSARQGREATLKDL